MQSHGFVTIYVPYLCTVLSYSVMNSFFLVLEGGRLLKGGAYLIFLALRGAISKRGAYFKLGANSRIYGTC